MNYPTVEELKKRLRESGDVFVNAKDEKKYWEIVAKLRESAIQAKENPAY